MEVKIREEDKIQLMREMWNRERFKDNIIERKRKEGERGEVTMERGMEVLFTCRDVALKF